MGKVSRRMTAASAALLAFGVAGSALAQDTVKIGAVYPLSGNSASTGNYAKMAFEMGADIINNGDPELAKIFPLAKGGGLPGLKGAKIQMLIADNQGTPAAGSPHRRRRGAGRPCSCRRGRYTSGDRGSCSRRPSSRTARSPSTSSAPWGRRA